MHFFPQTLHLLTSQKMMPRHFFSTLHPLSPVIFATATVWASLVYSFVLPRNSRFNFPCYTWREATPTQKSARNDAATSCDFLRKRLQRAFTCANQLHSTAQYRKENVLPGFGDLDPFQGYSGGWTIVREMIFCFECILAERLRLLC